MAGSRQSRAGSSDSLYLEAERLLRTGRPAEAERLCRRVLSQAPRDARALHLLGLAALGEGKPDKAVRLFERAVAADPGFALAFANLGTALRFLDRHEAALEALQRATVLDPGHPGYQNNLGVVLRRLGRLDEALDCFGLAVDLDPGFAEAHSNRGEVLRMLGRFGDAEASHERALALQPGALKYRLNFGRFLLAASRMAEAAGIFEGILATLGGRQDADAAILRADTTWNLGLVHLAEGRYAEGFAAYEARFTKRRRIAPPRAYRCPRWQGEDLRGKTLLVHHEQGLGDVIQFARYVPLLVERGARVVVECQAPLRRLLGTLDGVTAVIGDKDPLPAVDCVAPLLSLPHLFGTRLDTVPAAVPYLGVDVELARQWEARLAPREGMRVAFIWHGNPEVRDNRHRSADLGLFAPLFALPGITAFSLQFGASETERAALAAAGVTDLTPMLGDFADSAAALSHMDLLVSTDTGAVHLAGALGRPAWVLLHTSPDWRWGCEGEGSPWYPSLRLFRQQRFGEWAEVVGRVEAALRQRIAGTSR